MNYENITYHAYDNSCEGDIDAHIIDSTLDHAYNLVEHVFDSVWDFLYVSV